MTSSDKAPGWIRAELTLRLGKRRLDQLQRIAADLPQDATPTDAVDHALSLALPNIALADRMEDLESALASWTVTQREQTDQIQAGVDALARAMRDLHALISAAIAEDGLE